jgi:SNF2 family DNA or RNA helicase
VDIDLCTHEIIHDQVPLLLFSLHAVNVDLNITYANYILFLNAWWNATADEQGVGRAYRLGQEKEVNMYRFINAETI